MKFSLIIIFRLEMSRVSKTKQGSKKREIINKDKLKAAVYDVTLDEEKVWKPLKIRNTARVSRKSSSIVILGTLDTNLFF